MRRDFVSGLMLIAGAVAGVVVMGLHPTGHDLVAAAGTGSEGPDRLNVFVHGLALAATPVVFLGLLGLARRLGPSDLATAALVACGFGGVAVMSAAVASGFVSPGVIRHIVAANGSHVPDAFLLYTGLWNQGFAKVHVVAYSVGILVWSAAIFRTRRLARAAGIAGVVVGAGVLLFFLTGHLRLDVHGFGIITFAQSAWLIWVGILLCRRDVAEG